MNFRGDINGLRAIAVLGVLLFHFYPSILPGGFAGVDVFFVISGYLMTRIIFQGMESNSFNLLDFYYRRAQRIYPALIFLCFILIVFGWFFITPLDYKAVSKHVVSSLMFLSNVVYWRESGYFDIASHEKWLLHTWSLSVEWQFYLIYPVILLILREYFSFVALKRFIVIGFLIGYLLSVVSSFYWPSPSFYLLPTRAWEMLLGGLAFLFQFKFGSVLKRFLLIFGLGIIFISYLFLSEDVVWPGYWAIIPAVGAYFIILSNVSGSFLCSNRFLQSIGKWSYSIYLWHWPVVVLVYYYSLSDGLALCLFLVSIFLGFLSFTYIEKVKPEGGGHLSKVKASFISFFAVVIVSAGIYWTDGVVEHYPDEVIKAEFESVNSNSYHCMNDKFLPCIVGNANNVKAVVVGDSHAEALFTSISSSLDLSHEGIVVLSKSSCPFVLNLNKVGDYSCFNVNEKRLKYLIENYYGVPVFWIARTGSYFYGQTNPKRIRNDIDRGPSIFFTQENIDSDLLTEFKENFNLTISKVSEKHPVHIVLPVPEMNKNVPKELSRSLLLGIPQEMSVDVVAYHQRNMRVINILKDVAQMNSASTLSPSEYLCGQVCIAVLDGRPLYSDGDHMSEYGNKLLTPMFESAF
ncbi:acyltransferase family protein [Shewanella aegiceratis]|uniref:acyltransferase family protein n=1 Tax=Shewanella aegiceratis TaxID=2864203 RepID=UPI001C65EAC8|nr:acyltransferase family protein [Shewanella aegiceratis]QYJ83760.1 acyltransferase [Shewanella aegiceratis]